MVSSLSPSFDQDQLDQAWSTVSFALGQDMVTRGFSNNFYIHQCNLPLEGSLTLLARFQSLTGQEVISGQMPPLLLFGWHLLRTAQQHCTQQSFDLYVIETNETVVKAEQACRALIQSSNGAEGLEDLERFVQPGFCVDRASPALLQAETQELLVKWGMCLDIG